MNHPPFYFIDRSIRNILHEGPDDIIKSPLFHPHFELELARQSTKLQETLRTSALAAFNKNSINEMNFKHVDFFYIPKPRYLLRRGSYIELDDAVKYLALVLSIAELIETKRISAKRAIVHSYRYVKSGNHLFSKRYNFSSFRKRSATLSRKSKFKFRVITDISGFYERLNLHRLESQLLSIGAEPQTVSKINDLLFTWSGRNSYGIPVGGNASRILAEASLIDLDNDLCEEGIPYLRFVDDFRLFAADINQANYFLQRLQGRLADDGLSLNPEKTHIVPASAAEITQKQGAIFKRDKAPSDDTLTEHDAQRAAWTIYEGRVPLSYRRMSEEKRDDLKQLDVHETISAINDEPEPNPQVIQDIVRAIFVQGRGDGIVELFDIMKRYPKITPYVSQMLLTEAVEEDSIADQVAASSLEWLNDNLEKPDFVIVAIIRLVMGLRPESYTETFPYMMALPRSGSSIVGREAFLNIIPHLDRSRLLKVKSLYFRSTLAERRALIFSFIANGSMHLKEKIPWLKSIRTTNHDMFIERMIGKFLGESPSIKRKKKRRQATKKRSKN